MVYFAEVCDSAVLCRSSVRLVPACSLVSLLGILCVLILGAAPRFRFRAAACLLASHSTLPALSRLPLGDSLSEVLELIISSYDALTATVALALLCRPYIG